MNYMRFMTIIIALAITVSSQSEASEKSKHLFILSGQSNMARMNPEESFIPTVVEAFGKSNVTVVKEAKGGKPISSWYQKGKVRGSLYKSLMRKVKYATKGKTYDTVTFVWMQGERDAKRGDPSTYADSFKGLLAFLKEDLQLTSINVVIGRLSDNSKGEKWMQMREIQVKLAEGDPKAEWVDTDDLNDIKKGDKTSNGLHCTKEGFKTLGNRFADKAIELIKKQPKK